MSFSGGTKNQAGRNRSNPRSPPNLRAFKRKQALERQEKYDALSLEEKKKTAGAKVLAKLMNPKKAVATAASGATSTAKSAPLTAEQKAEKKQQRKQAVLEHQGQVSAPTEESQVVIPPGFQNAAVAK